MKQLMTILILVFLTASVGWANSDSFSGQVLKLEKERGLMVVVPFRAESHRMHRRAVGGQGMGSEKIEVFFLPALLPDFARKGQVIRFKGHFFEENRTKFRAEQFLPFGGLSNDPTGVRKRLLKQSSCEHQREE